MEPLDYFMDRMEPEPMSGCWLWTGGISPKGYGRSNRMGLSQQAHRAVWTLIRGPVPEGLVLDHKCRVRTFINPNHLRVATPRENVLAPGSLAIPALNAAKKACPKCGGEFVICSSGRTCPACKKRDDEKRRLDPVCRAAHLAASRRFRLRQKAKLIGPGTDDPFAGF